MTRHDYTAKSFHLLFITHPKTTLADFKFFKNTKNDFFMVSIT